MKIIFTKEQLFLISVDSKVYTFELVRGNNDEERNEKASQLRSSLIHASKAAEQRNAEWIVCSVNLEGLCKDDLNMDYFLPIYGMEDGYQLNI